jgi:adenylate cyclase
MLILVYNTQKLIAKRVEETKHAVLEKEQREKAQKLFERYFSEKIARYLADNPPELGGKSRQVTVLVADLRGFTRRSEILGPAASVNLLNRIFDELVAIIFRYGGTLDKFLGDGMLVVFGVPEPSPDDAWHAVQAAREMSAAVRRLEASNDLSMGFAINSGEVIFGNIGSRQRMEFTIVGDTVNTASRMESLNKDFGTDIIISESTLNILGDKVTARRLPEVTLRGKQGIVALYGVET